MAAWEGASGRHEAAETRPPGVGKERELLSAVRYNGGSAAAAEITMGTSLGVKEADQMLSELAAGGHLRAEVEGGGTLSYALPARRSPEIGG
jgi:hypothetical protein